ncbi:MAG: hypothetical protein ABSE56_07590 [Bryobacteraceae bacterium]|jgi:hypothetical protein
MRWVLQNPIVFYALMALCLGLCLDLFVALKREIRAGRRRQEAFGAAIGQLSAKIGELREKVLENEARAAVLVAPTPLRSGVNLSTRSQALRMFRRGATNQQIAAALGVPEKEVELLLKVQQMALDAPPPAEDASPPAAGLKPAATGMETPLKAQAAAPAIEAVAPAARPSSSRRRRAANTAAVESVPTGVETPARPRFEPGNSAAAGS